MKNYIEKAIQASIKAGVEIMKIYSKDFAIEFKDDKSPLTEADKISNQIICEELQGTFPIISEENKTVEYPIRQSWDTCWLIDPIDGTKEFIKKNGEFTVNIALIKNGTPILGVVYLPAKQTLYFASEDLGSFKYVFTDSEFNTELEHLLNQSIRLKDQLPPDKYTIVASRSHMSAETEEFIEDCKKNHGEVELISSGSSIKLCLVAERSAHVYPRIAPTMEWDTAAAHAVAKYAGCKVKSYLDGSELIYNKENLLNPYFIVSLER